MIEIVGLTKEFGTRRAVDNVTVDFPAGSVTALLGLNGAGKTTLLRLIAGLDTPDTGTVQRPPLGVHLGPGAMDPRHTVQRHMCWLAALADIGPEPVARVMAEAGLDAYRREHIGGLSLGARQRLAIAAALLDDPPAVLFDEPLNGLDIPGIVWFRELLCRLAAEQRTVVVATHLLGEVVVTADRIVMLDRGRLWRAGPLQDVVPAGSDHRQWLESALMDCV